MCTMFVFLSVHKFGPLCTRAQEIDNVHNAALKCLKIMFRKEKTTKFCSRDRIQPGHIACLCYDAFKIA